MKRFQSPPKVPKFEFEFETAGLTPEFPNSQEAPEAVIDSERSLNLSAARSTPAEWQEIKFCHILLSLTSKVGGVENIHLTHLRASVVYKILLVKK